MAKARKESTEIVVAPQQIENAICVVRGQRVMLDADLARMYGVTTSAESGGFSEPGTVPR